MKELSWGQPRQKRRQVIHAVTAVVVSLMPGESAFNATSTLCLMPKAGSCSTVYGGG